MLRKGVYLNLVMEYMPGTLSRIIKDNFSSKKYLPTATIVQYAKCLITALKDIHVKVVLCRLPTSVTEILSPLTFSSVSTKPSFATLVLPRS